MQDLEIRTWNSRPRIQDSIVGEFAMTEPAYDLLIRGGRVATVSDVFEADVAISGETIAAIGRGHRECRYVRERDRLGGLRRHHHRDPVRGPARRHEAAAGAGGVSRA